MTLLMTRVDVGDFERWKPLFDEDPPRARADAKGWKLFRSTANPGEVFVQVEYTSIADAETARDRLLASGILDRFPDHHGPVVVEEAEAVTR